MALIARVYRSDPEERRAAVRYPVEVGATVRASDGQPLDVLVYDLSMTGFRMETTESLDLDAPIWIGIAGTRVNAAVVARRGPNGYGCEFVMPITLYQLTEALDPEPTVHEMTWSDDARPDDCRDAPVEKRPGWEWLALIAAGVLILVALLLWLL